MDLTELEPSRVAPKTSMKERRRELGLSQRDVAEKLGISWKTYGSYERGYRGVELGMAVRIAEVLQCSVDELAGCALDPDEERGIDPNMSRAYLSLPADEQGHIRALTIALARAHAHQDGAFEEPLIG